MVSAKQQEVLDRRTIHKMVTLLIMGVTPNSSSLNGFVVDTGCLQNPVPIMDLIPEQNLCLLLDCPRLVLIGLVTALTDYLHLVTVVVQTLAFQTFPEITFIRQVEHHRHHHLLVNPKVLALFLDGVHQTLVDLVHLLPGQILHGLLTLRGLRILHLEELLLQFLPDHLQKAGFLRQRGHLALPGE